MDEKKLYQMKEAVEKAERHQKKINGLSSAILELKKILLIKVSYQNIRITIFPFDKIETTVRTEAVESIISILETELEAAKSEFAAL